MCLASSQGLPGRLAFANPGDEHEAVLQGALDGDVRAAGFVVAANFVGDGHFVLSVVGG